MPQDGVNAAFDIIFEEVDSFVVRLNHKGANAFENGNYKEVSRLKKLGEELTEFREKISELKIEWDNNFAGILDTSDIQQIPEEAAILDTSEKYEELQIIDPSLSSGDKEFLSDAETKLSRKSYHLAKQLLLGVRNWYKGDLEFQGPSKFYKESPENFWTVHIQTRKDRLQITIQKTPDNYQSNIFDLQLTFRTYTKFFLESEENLAEALRLIKQSANYKGLRV